VTWKGNRDPRRAVSESRGVKVISERISVTETTIIKLRGDEISVSAKQAARLIGLPLRTLQADTKAGRVPAARRLGRRYVYLIDELKRMVESAVRPGMG
jgi:hypothetical protein